MRVLVIGASFSGLTAANRLLQLEGKDDQEQDTSQTGKEQDADNNTTSGNTIDVDIVDALRPPSDDSVFVGDITVPAAQSVLKTLGLLPVSAKGKNQSDNTEKNMLAKFNDVKNCDISRQELLDCLRRRVTVHYRHVVRGLWMEQIKEDEGIATTDINSMEEHQRSSTTALSCWAKVQVQEATGIPQNSSDNDDDDRSGEFNAGRPDIIQMGPYDAVIVATGTRSQFPIRTLVQHPSSWPWVQPEPTVILATVGDARYTRWWDFGQHRIRQGANQALVDGLELGNALLQVAVEQQQQQQQDYYRGGVDSKILMRIIPGKFHFPQTWMFSTYLCLLGIIVAIFAAGQY